MTFKMISVESSDIDKIGYDSATKVLKVVFRKGTTYHYENVPEAVYIGLVCSPHPGKVLHEAVKMAGYKYKQVK